jgi:hypothetical protein
MNHFFKERAALLKANMNHLSNLFKRLEESRELGTAERAPEKKSSCFKHCKFHFLTWLESCIRIKLISVTAMEFSHVLEDCHKSEVFFTKWHTNECPYPIAVSLIQLRSWERGLDPPASSSSLRLQSIMTFESDPKTQKMVRPTRISIV